MFLLPTFPPNRSNELTPQLRLLAFWTSAYSKNLLAAAGLFVFILILEIRSVQRGIRPI